LKALPHLHRKLRAGETAGVSAAQSLALMRYKKLSPKPQHMNGRSIATHQDCEMKNDGVSGYRQEPSVESRNGTGSASANGRVARREQDKYADLMPLPFLLEVLNDAKTPANLKVKVSLATLPFTHAKHSKQEKQAVVDRCRFTVDRVLATKLRNEIARLSVLKKRRNPSPQAPKTIQRLEEKIRAKLTALQCPCPSRYGAGTPPMTEKGRFIWGANAGRGQSSRRTRMRSMRTSTRDTGHMDLVQKLRRENDSVF
jgi:hypothetical protein